MTNVLLNSAAADSRDDVMKKCDFYSGDWQDLASHLTRGDNYDYILTSETVYNTQNYNKLLHIFKQTLKPHGTMYPL